MKMFSKTRLALSIPLFLVLIFFYPSCSRNIKGSVLITISGVQQAGNGSITSITEQIASINPDKPTEPLILLTKEFYSATSPQVSYDGRRILFTGKKTKDSPWQICEMDKNGAHKKQITSTPENCTDPLYLPGNRIAFTKSPSGQDSKTRGQQLYVCNTDGTDLRQITFSPDSYTTLAVMKDGRMLILHKQLSPAEGLPVLMAIRPDGTKAELFSQGAEGTMISGPVSETSDNKIIFLESDPANNGKKNIISINYNRPLHSRVLLSAGLDCDFTGATPWKDGKLLVSCRKQGAEIYGLYEFDPGSKSLGTTIYENNEYSITGAVVAEVHDRPKKLPSEVDMGVKTGLVFCQNINIHGNSVSGGTTPVNSKRIEIVGVDSLLGAVDTEADGSFFLKVVADTPFRIRTLDEKGNIIYGPCDWVWVRPNERRGCVGCHENHEIVPGNIRPLSVIKNPVSVPVHINKVVEKKVSLE